jgi:hypothetical protein
LGVCILPFIWGGDTLPVLCDNLAGCAPCQKNPQAASELALDFGRSSSTRPAGSGERSPPFAANRRTTAEGQPSTARHSEATDAHGAASEAQPRCAMTHAAQTASHGAMLVAPPGRGDGGATRVASRPRGRVRRLSRRRSRRTRSPEPTCMLCAVHLGAHPATTFAPPRFAPARARPRRERLLLPPAASAWGAHSAAQAVCRGFVRRGAPCLALPGMAPDTPLCPPLPPPPRRVRMGEGQERLLSASSARRSGWTDARGAGSEAQARCAMTYAAQTAPHAAVLVVAACGLYSRHTPLPPSAQGGTSALALE